MVDVIIAGAIGLFVGAVIGMIITALMVAASDRDREEDNR